MPRNEKKIKGNTFESKMTLREIAPFKKIDTIKILDKKGNLVFTFKKVEA